MVKALSALTLMLLLIAPAYGQKAEPAGTVNRLEGIATATRGGIALPLDDGMIVYVGDRISTGGDTRLRLHLTSGATIALGDNSSMTVEAHESKVGGRSVFEFLEGVFLAVSAAMTESSTDAMTIRTPSAVLGIRGTEVWAEQKPGHLGVIMLTGTSVLVTAPEGVAELNAPLLGTDVRAGQPPTTPKTWGQKRIDAARRSVAFE